MERNKKQRYSAILVIVMALVSVLSMVSVAFAAPTKVICVPWQGDINKYHTTWSGQQIILKGVIKTDSTDSIWYKWNFGDGTESGIIAQSGNTKYNVEITKTYTGAEGTPFTAKLIVADNNALANPIEDPYLIKIEAANLDSKINVAIDNGLWYLYKNGYTSGANYHTFDSSPITVWSYGSHFTSPTASAVQAFQINGHKETGDPDQDPYVEAVEGGLNWLFNGYYSNTNHPMLRPYSISVQSAGDPDTNSNGIGIDARDYSYNEVYQSGMVMDAIIASGTPDADSGRDFDGDGSTDTYREVIQDMCDMYAFGQNDSGGSAGGWRYHWNYGSSDNSISQWAAIGMIPAQEPPWNCVVPAWVKTLNNGTWLWNSYNTWTSGGVDYGGYGYTSQIPIWGYYAVTPSGMVQLSFSGSTTSDPRWAPCERWLADNWTTGSNWLGSGNVYGYFAFAKAMRLAQPDPVVTFSSNNFDWYRGDGVTMGLAERISNQLIAHSYWDYYGRNLGTAWCVIILKPVLFAEAPVACFDADPNPSYPDSPISFDPYCSGHSEPGKDISNLTLFEWDWDNDGVYDESTFTPDVVTHSFACDAIPCTYPVTLKVTDDSVPERSATYVTNILISNPPHPPVAKAGGPYWVSLCPGDVLTLDGSSSYDPNEGEHEAGCGACPDDTITAWDWDLAGAPWDYTDKPGEVVDISSDYTTYFPSAGAYDIGLRTTDNTALAYPSSDQPNLTDEDFDVVNVFDGCICEVTAEPDCLSVTLSWDDVGAERYDIYRSFIGPNTAFQYIGSTTTNTKTAGSFVMDKDHWYRIMAVTGENECLSKAVTVRGDPSLCNPTADPGGPYEGCIDEQVTLDGSGSTALAGIIVSWEWDLDNDGEYDDALGETVQFTWNTEGAYTIGLKVTSSDSLTLIDEAFTTVKIEVCEIPQPNLWAVQYRWGDPAPGYSFANWPIFESWMNVRIENLGTGEAFNVTGSMSSCPSNTTIVEPDVTVGNIPAGGSAWSVDTFTTEVDMANQVAPCEECFWRIDYDDAAGVHHVVENVPEFPPGEGPTPCP